MAIKKAVLSKMDSGGETWDIDLIRYKDAGLYCLVLLRTQPADI